jgi:hypothetical protein
MESVLGIWIDVVTDFIEVSLLFGILWQFFRLKRDITAMLRVIRRVDRKMAPQPVEHELSPAL